TRASLCAGPSVSGNRRTARRPVESASARIRAGHACSRVDPGPAQPATHLHPAPYTRGRPRAGFVRPASVVCWPPDLVRDRVIPMTHPAEGNTETKRFADFREFYPYYLSEHANLT